MALFRGVQTNEEYTINSVNVGQYFIFSLNMPRNREAASSGENSMVNRFRPVSRTGTMKMLEEMNIEMNEMVGQQTMRVLVELEDST